MGHEIDTGSFTREDFQAFGARLKEETELFKRWWKEGVFAEDAPRMGFELEAWLVDREQAPAPRNAEVLARAQEPLLAPELAQYNIEFNSTPQGLSGRPFSAMQAQLSQLWQRTAVAAGPDTRLAMVGILPSLRAEDMGLERMSRLQRYQALNEQVLALRNQRPLRLDIDGEQPLRLEQNSVMLESAATSLQLHLQVTPASAPAFYNASVLASAACVAVAANSPYLFGHSLWQETRIPLFEQAVAVAPLHGGHAGPYARVSFGSGYGRDALYGFFVENRQHFPVLLPVLLDEPVERLPHLALHNGTIWRWNRPLVGFNDDGRPHLRIEHRVMAAGPSSVDVAANAAFFYGLAFGLAQSDQGIDSRLPFAVAEQNFYEAARYGLAAQVTWLGGRHGSLRELILEELLLLARRGLERAGVEAAEAAHYLGIIEARVRTERTGASWQQSFVQRYGPDFRGLVAAYMERQNTAAPVHEWTL